MKFLGNLNDILKKFNNFSGMMADLFRDFLYRYAGASESFPTSQFVHSAYWQPLAQLLFQEVEKKREKKPSAKKYKISYNFIFI